MPDYVHRPTLTFSLQLITSLSLQMLHHYLCINTFSFSVSLPPAACERRRQKDRREEDEDSLFLIPLPPYVSTIINRVAVAPLEATVKWSSTAQNTVLWSGGHQQVVYSVCTHSMATNTDKHIIHMLSMGAYPNQTRPDSSVPISACRYSLVPEGSGQFQAEI